MSQKAFLSSIEFVFEASVRQIIDIFVNFGCVTIKDLILTLNNNNLIRKDIYAVKEILENVNELIKQGLLEISLQFISKWNIKTKDIRIVNVDKALEYFSSLNGFTVSNISDYDEEATCWNIEYCLNLDQINILMRNHVILENIKFLLNDECYIIMYKYLDRFQSVEEEFFEQPIQFDELRNLVMEIYDEISDEAFNNSIYLLTEKSDSQIQFLEQIDTNCGSVLQFDMNNVVEQLITRQIETTIFNCYDLSGLALFRFVKKNNYVEENVLMEKFANQDKHEFTDLILGMMNDGFLYKHEYSKTKNFLKFDVFYQVNLQGHVRSSIEMSYKILTQLSQKNIQLTRERKGLYEKFHKIRYELNNETSADVDNQIPLITELENKELAEIDEQIYRIGSATYQINCSMVLFERYLWYQKNDMNY